MATNTVIEVWTVQRTLDTFGSIGWSRLATLLKADDRVVITYAISPVGRHLLGVTRENLPAMERLAAQRKGV